ncbi:MAG: glycosyltransferase [Rhodospirillales bacterium]|nr:glycosyltransferase [Rhodospirillales bacterium]
MGRVKTRLGRDIGTIDAWTFYRRNLMDMARRMAADTRWRTWLSLTPDNAPNPPQLPASITIMAQGSGDLGTRMSNAMVALPPGPVVIIGTDIPAITRPRIARAFSLLGQTDTVFGPAADGGYWLVGSRRRPRFPDMFRNVRWSTEHALSDTLANVSRERLSAGLLDILEDVDDAASYERWRKHDK